MIVSVHAPVSPSAPVAVSVVAYVPAGTAAPTVTVPVAGCPSAADGVTPDRAMPGTVPVSASPVTRPSGSVAETARVAGSPATTASGPPHVATGSCGPVHGTAGDAELRGAGAARAKSAALSSVSWQPPSSRKPAFWASSAGIAPAPSKSSAVP